jgi:hypothetical protein
VNLQPEYLNPAWYLHQRESLFDYLRKFNNETSEHSEIKPARDLLRDEMSVVKAEIHSALSIYRSRFKFPPLSHARLEVSGISRGGAEPGANILSARKETTTRRVSILLNL